MSLPAVARWRWGRSRCRGHGSPSAWLGAPVCGVRAVALAPDSRADFLLKFFWCRRGKVIEIDAEVRAARPTPAATRPNCVVSGTTLLYIFYHLSRPLNPLSK